MGYSRRVRTDAVVAAVALAVAVVPCASARAAVPGSTVAASSSVASAGERLTNATPLVAPPSPTATTPGPSVPTEADVAKAKKAAADAAKEVADITARVELAGARLEALQRAVAEAVSAHEQAQQQLGDAEESVRQATAGLAVARLAREDADRALSASAAQIYMQGGDLQNMTTMLLSPPGVMSDLALVLDQDAHRVRQELTDATSAAVDATSQEHLLISARDNRAVAVDDAVVKRTAAEKQAAQAGAEAARLGDQQEALTQRLAELTKGAADLVALREAAARLGRATLLGVQRAGAPGTGPLAAQEVAHSMVASYGWDDAEFTCLVKLWYAESGWSWSAMNAASGAYGIPQALPGWKMGSAGSDWLTNPATQITWGMDYIASVYGSPCQADDRWLARSPHWY